MEANLQEYHRSASRYDSTETCLVSVHHQLMLQSDLDYVLSIMRKHLRRKPHALDACGGSGNVALRLLARGADVTLCDISPEMISLFESKCKENKMKNYTTICQEIGSYLASTKLKFDLIVFSSALHHIEDYTSILKMAVSHLNKNGFVYTVFDPIKCPLLTRQILWIETILNAAIKYPSEACWTARKRLVASFTREGPSQFTRYEYYARSGIDDYSLVNSLKGMGIEVFLHDRYPDARYTITRILLSALKRPTAFKLLLRLH